MGGIPVAADLVAMGNPGGTPASTQACWTVSFDLANTTMTFDLGGDADGIWSGVPNADSFGWGVDFTNAGTSGGFVGTGPIIAGNCPIGGITNPQRGFQTSFGGVPGATDSTGLGTNDFFWIDTDLIGTGLFGGCFFFGGCTPPGTTGPAANPYASFYMQLFGRKGGPQPVGTSYCSSLLNATGSAAVLTASASDRTNDLVLTSQPVPNTIGQFFYGPMMLLGTQSLGDGLRCVGGMTTRLLPFIRAGMMTQADNSAVFTVNYTAPYASGLTGTQHFQHWFREPAGTSVSGSNSSTGISIAF